MKALRSALPNVICKAITKGVAESMQSYAKSESHRADIKALLHSEKLVVVDIAIPCNHLPNVLVVLRQDPALFVPSISPRLHYRR